MKNKGTFYGVGVGPGDPELMTYKAGRILTSCKVIAVPRANGEGTTALDIAAKMVDLEGKNLIYIDFPMTANSVLLSQSHALAAQAVIRELEAGNDVAMPTLGDPSVYSTVGYVAKLVEKKGYKVEIIAGVTSFCAAAALLKTGITDMDSPLHIMPASFEQLEEDLELRGTKVIMKYGKKFPAVREALRRAGQLEDAVLVKNCGMEGEAVCYNLDEAQNTGYFSLIIVRDNKSE